MIQALLVIVLLLGGAAGAVTVSDQAAPGDLLYSLDRSVESVRLSMARGPEQVAQLQANLAQERLQELQRLSERNDQANLPAAFDNLSEAVLGAAQAASGGDFYQANQVALLVDQAVQEQPVSPTARCQNLPAAGHPAARTLADRFGVDYEEIIGWFCQGYGFGEIQLAYQLAGQSDFTVEEIFELRAGGMGWGEIMQVVGAIDLPAREDLNDDPEDNQGEVITGTLETDPEWGDQARCTGSQPHPHAQTLASRFGVEYDEIMGWFCQGYGFGEIQLAYQISLRADVTVEEVFAARAAGEGWGNIKKDYEYKNNPKDKTPGTDDTAPGRSEDSQGKENDNNGNSDKDNNGNKDKEKDNNGKAKGKNK